MSSFLGFCEWNTRNRWRDGQVCPDVDKGIMEPWSRRLRVCFGVGQVCPDVDKELWRLGPDGSVCFGVLCANKKKEVKRDFGDLRIRSEGACCEHTFWCLKGSFQETRRPRKRKRGDPKGEVEEKGTRESGKEKG
ncbi:hypothetical protein TNCV_1234491 [Trichonephila clavipes]|nr:hypothetical protein TNCV_1234491 [Trichonephila clavipes]